MLEVRIDSADVDFLKIFKLLLPLKDFYNWADSKKVEIDSDFDVENDQTEITKTFDFLSKNVHQLNPAVEAKMLNKISFTKYSNIYFHGQELALPIDSAKLGQNQLFLSCFSLHAQKSLEINVPIVYDAMDFDSKYCESVKKMNSVWNLILEKASLINKISFGYTSSYYQSTKELSIGASDSVNDLVRVLRGIK